MAALIEIPLGSELLTADEVAEITGTQRRPQQIEWLKQKQWVHHINRAGTPIVGRLYARMKMAGLNMQGPEVAWSPDLSGV